jgi:hypothetical protein
VDEIVDAGGDAPDGPPSVACTANAGCPTSAPVCDPEDQVCRTCVADAECDGACHELTGRCFAEANVLYIAPDGSNNLSCSKLTPCDSVDTALQRATAIRMLIRVADGTYAGDWNVKQQGGSGGTSVIMSGTDIDPASAVFEPGNAASDLQTDQNTTLVLEGITIRKPEQNGLIVRGTVTLSHVVIEETPGSGVDVRAAGALTVLDSRIEGAQGAGVSSANSLEVHRSHVLNNTGGGIAASGAFTIVNTVIANNGTQLGGMFGGVRLAPVPGKSAVFRFNTVTRNTSGGAAAGVQCDLTAVVEDSIIHSNTGLLVPELGTSCSARYCLLATTPATGNNVQGNPMFVNAASDFHLMAGSPAIDKADPAATETLDVDGGDRPHGSARDIGADERP